LKLQNYTKYLTWKEKNKQKVFIKMYSVVNMMINSFCMVEIFLFQKKSVHLQFEILE